MLFKIFNQGSKVRSYDFPSSPFGRELTGERACYVEGIIVGTELVADGVRYYRILVRKDVFGGQSLSSWPHG